VERMAKKAIRDRDWFGYGPGLDNAIVTAVGVVAASLAPVTGLGVTTAEYRRHTSGLRRG
jgi:hypothetical protein